MNSNRKRPKKMPKSRRAISDVHIARATYKLTCKNCMYANFCAAQPTLRAYVEGVMHKDMSGLLYNENYQP